jgi:hypothetical protein
MSSPHTNEGRTPQPSGSGASASAASSHDHLPSLGQAPSIAQSDTPSSTTSFGGFSAGLSVDDDDRDVDSAIFDVNQAQSSMSITSSVYDFVVEHGRTYHRYKQGKYWMPNDKREQERLDLQHMICVKVFGNRLTLAPIREPARVLDFGTGTGTWAIEFAIQHPGSEVIGTDLSPIQPEYVPPNCRFEIDDIEDEWMFSTKFDYVRIHQLITTKNM